MNTIRRPLLGRLATRALQLSAKLSIVLIAGAAISCGSTTSTNNGSQLTLITPGTLTVAVWGTAQPGIEVSGETVGGLDGVLINAFVADHHLKLSLFKTTFASGILTVQQKKADMGSYYYWTADRAKQAYYSAAYYEDVTAVFTLNSFSYTGPDSLKGKKVGTVTGFVYVPYLQKLYGSNAVLFPDEASAGIALLNGQIQGYVNSTGAIYAPPLNTATNVTSHLLQAGDMGMPDSVLVNKDYNIVSCQNSPLADALDAELAKLRSSGAWAKAREDNHVSSEPDVDPTRPQQGCG